MTVHSRFGTRTRSTQSTQWLRPHGQQRNNHFVYCRCFDGVKCRLPIVTVVPSCHVVVRHVTLWCITVLRDGRVMIGSFRGEVYIHNSVCHRSRHIPTQSVTSHSFMTVESSHAAMTTPPRFGKLTTTSTLVNRCRWLCISVLHTLLK